MMITLERTWVFYWIPVLEFSIRHPRSLLLVWGWWEFWYSAD